MSTLEELEAEVDRCIAALSAAKQTLREARLASAKYKVGDLVMADRRLPGTRGYGKKPWPGRIRRIMSGPSYNIDIRYSIQWKLKNGDWSIRNDSVREAEIKEVTQVTQDSAHTSL